MTAGDQIFPQWVDSVKSFDELPSVDGKYELPEGYTHAISYYENGDTDTVYVFITDTNGVWQRDPVKIRTSVAGEGLIYNANPQSLIDYTVPEIDPVAYMFPSDLDEFAKKETSATAYSIAMGQPGEDTVGLYGEKYVSELLARIKQLEAEQTDLNTKCEKLHVALDAALCSVERNVIPVKIARDEKDAWDKQERFEGNPSAWLQWKGTDVCMDVHCKCGYHSHFDDSFTYHIECPKCRTVYFCNGHIELIEVLERPKYVKTTEYEEEWDDDV